MSPECWLHYKSKTHVHQHARPLHQERREGSFVIYTIFINRICQIDNINTNGLDILDGSIAARQEGNEMLWGHLS